MGHNLTVLSAKEVGMPLRLAGGVWTRDLGTAHKVLRGITADTIWINCYGVLDPSVGFGGTKMSGYGWKGGREHVESYLYPEARLHESGLTTCRIRADVVHRRDGRRRRMGARGTMWR